MATNKNSNRPKDFIDPSLPSKCTWKLGTKEKCPHSKMSMPQQQKLYPNILEAIGCTPLVRLNKIPQAAGIKCEMYAKCEFMNPGGSIKDRIAHRMIEDAEREGRIAPGWTLIEATAGNTGIGLALAATIKGYRCIIVMPENISIEKEYILKALNAEVVRASKNVPFDDPRSIICVAQRMAREIPNAIILDQMRSASNPLAHYDGTGPEILWQTDGKVDMVVCGAATGGTVTGVGRYIKEKLPSCKIIGVDPCGSQVARPVALNQTDVKSWNVEGMGFSFAMTVIDHSVVDNWFKTTDMDTFPMCRRLIIEEGLLVGGSSGAIMTGALRAAKDLKEGQRCVVLLPDGIRNYMTKFVSDNWMEANNLKEIVNVNDHWWWDFPISEMKLPHAEFINTATTFREAIEFMKERKLTQVPIVDANDGSELIGVVLQDTLINSIVSGNAQLEDPVSNAINTAIIRLQDSDIIGKLARVLETGPCVLIVKKEGCKDILQSLATKMDVMTFVAAKK